MNSRNLKLLISAASVIAIAAVIARTDFSPALRLSLPHAAILGTFSLFIILAWILYFKIFFSAFRLSVKYSKAATVTVPHYILRQLSSLVGSVSIVVLIRTQLGVSLRRAIVMTVSDLALRLGVRGVVGCIGAVWILGLHAPVVVSIAVPILVIIGIFFRFRFRPAGRIFGGRRSQRYGTVIRRGLRGVSWGRLLFALAIYAVISLSYSVLFWIILRLNNAPVNLFLLWGVNTLSLWSGTLSLIPFGLGVQDLTTTGLLVAVGVDRTLAMNAVVLNRLFVTFLPLIFTLATVALFPISREPEKA